MALTKMGKSTICVAGIDESGQWIRPIREESKTGGKKRFLYPSDIWDKGKLLLDEGNVVTISLGDYVPQLTHTEDWMYNFSSSPIFHEQLDGSRWDMFLKDNSETVLLPPDIYRQPGQSRTEDEIRDYFYREKKSLMLIRPYSIDDFTFNAKTRFGGDRHNIKFCMDPNSSPIELPCTDLRWRALGKMLRDGDERQYFNYSTLAHILEVEDFYFTIGLSRIDNIYKKNYVMVVGVHTIPRFNTISILGKTIKIRLKRNEL